MTDEAKVLTRNWGKPDSHTVEVYLQSGGYEAAKKALAMAPAQVSQVVLDAGLRGRGGAGFPTGRKWTFMPKDDRPRYLCVNADESEPGTFKDREIMRRDPHLLIEGAIIACWAMGCKAAFIYVRGEFVEPADRMEAAVKEAYAKGFLGKNILGTDRSLDLAVHRGAGAYICGEETALMSSLEGRRGYPKIRPPFPPQRGLFGMPTTINNVESIAAVPFIINHGAAAYKKFGTEKSPGTKLFSISGHVRKPGVYEVPLGMPLLQFIRDVAGGMLNNLKLKAVIPGGSSTPILTAEEAEKVALDYESLAAAKTMLGSGAIIVIGEGTCMVRALEVLAHFYADESCGQCTPCREGTGWMEKILSRLHEGHGRMEDIDLLTSLADGMSGRTICPLADAAAMPVQSFIKKFRAEFEEHVSKKKCPYPDTFPVKW